MTTSAARWLVLASALLFSTGGAAIKTGAFSAAQVSAGRSGIAAIVLALYLTRVEGGRPQLSPALLPAGVLYAVIVAATAIRAATEPRSL